MALLFQLIRTLNENELKAISVMPMQDREREVFNTIRNVKQKVFPSLSISKQLNLQAGHLDKINSVLLKKSMEVLAGSNIYDQINYLSSKTGQWNLAKHLLKSYELKTLTASVNSEEKKAFYKFCFEWIITVPFSHQELPEVEYYANSFLATVDDSEKPKMQLWINTILLRRKINIAISRAAIYKEPDAGEIKNELNILLANAEKLNDPQAVFKVKSLAIVYYNLLRRFDLSLQTGEEIKKLISDHPAEFSAYENWQARWYIAQTYFHSSRFEEAYAFYLTLAEDADSGNKAKWFMFYGEYLQVCLVTDRLEKAEEIVEQYFRSYTDDVNGTIFISASLQIAKFYMYSERYDEAGSVLAYIKKNLLKTTMLQFQFAVKELFVALAYLTGDDKKAIHLAEQNLKFMRFKNIHRTMPDYTFHSRLVKPISKFKSSGTPLNAKELFMLEELQQGTRAQYGKLLMRWMHQDIKVPN